MLATEPDSPSKRFCANVTLEGSSPAIVSIPRTGASPAPPVTPDGPAPPAPCHMREEAKRNSTPVLKAWAAFVQFIVSVYVYRGLSLPVYAPLTMAAPISVGVIIVG